MSILLRTFLQIDLGVHRFQCRNLIRYVIERGNEKRVVARYRLIVDRVSGGKLGTQPATVEDRQAERRTNAEGPCRQLKNIRAIADGDHTGHRAEADIGKKLRLRRLDVFRRGFDLPARGHQIGATPQQAHRQLIR